MKNIAMIFALLAATTAHAQYKCVVNGKATYSDVPCAANARYVGAMEDSVSDRARTDAELLRRKEAVQRNYIDRQQNSDFHQNQRALTQQAAAADSAARASATRCANQRQNLARNQRSQDFYRDLGMQHSLNNRQQEAKAINDNIFRDCP